MFSVHIDLFSRPQPASAPPQTISNEETKPNEIIKSVLDFTKMKENGEGIVLRFVVWSFLRKVIGFIWETETPSFKEHRVSEDGDKQEGFEIGFETIL